MAARISEISFTKNPESEIWRVGGEGVGCG